MGQVNEPVPPGSQLALSERPWYPQAVWSHALKSIWPLRPIGHYHHGDVREMARLLKNAGYVPEEGVKTQDWATQVLSEIHLAERERQAEALLHASAQFPEKYPSIQKELRNMTLGQLISVMGDLSYEECRDIRRAVNAHRKGSRNEQRGEAAPSPWRGFRPSR